MPAIAPTRWLLTAGLAGLLCRPAAALTVQDVATLIERDVPTAVIRATVRPASFTRLELERLRALGLPRRVLRAAARPPRGRPRRDRAASGRRDPSTPTP